MANGKKSADIYPQTFNMKVTESAANTFTQESYPCNRHPDKAWEILKALIFVNPPDAEAGQTNRVEVQVTKKSVSTQLDPVDRDCLVHSWIQCDNIATEGHQTIRGYWEQIDLTDGAGHGILLANDNLYINVAGTGNASAKSGRAKLIYREVSPSEKDLIGLLQEASG